jgi:hypothetical protein
VSSVKDRAAAYGEGPASPHLKSSFAPPLALELGRCCAQPSSALDAFRAQSKNNINKTTATDNKHIKNQESKYKEY